MQVIGGVRRDGSGPDLVDVVNPATSAVVEQYPGAVAADVEAAVSAAKAAYGPWSRATPGERAAALFAWADLLETRAEQLAQRETLQTGKPIRLATGFDVPGSIDNVCFFAGAARQLAGQATGEYSADHTSSIRREPIGVVGSIAPWNYPLQMAMWKILPAIAAGNTIVLKPAENTPLTSVDIAVAATEAGVPDGVINVVSGVGAVAGEALMAHPDVRMVSFTGSTAVGRRGMEGGAGG
ncbi:MAG TPA: aldehyde dehydrogenase family protein, partial [Dermatophilaceae bacterium]|nr:aldehyde dehydrogenase family protein [Dermatophilaceae bacterium]